MEFRNPNLKQAIAGFQSGALDQRRFIVQLDTIYRANPKAFTEEEVDYIEKQFKKTDIKFNRDLEAADANLLSTANQFISGMVEGFTTLGWSEEPDTTAESIANKLGHLIGFAPDVVASVLSMGQYVPIATAKAISRKSAGAVSKGLQKAGEKAPAILRKELAPDTFALQSIPMKVADVVMDNVKASLGSANVTTTGYLSRGIFANTRFRDIGEQALHLGVAMGVSSWKEGPKGAAEAGVYGAAAGTLFGTIGNYVNVARLIANPKTTPVGQKIVRGVAKRLVEDEEKYRAMNMLIRGSLGAGVQGGMATAQQLPVAEQVYEYLLGAFFGASARDRGFIERTRYINKNFAKFGDITTPVETVAQKLRKDPDFQKLNKFDQDYVIKHIAVTQQQIFNNINRGVLNPEIAQEVRKIAKELGIELEVATPKQIEKITEKLSDSQIIKKDLEGIKYEIRDDNVIPEVLKGATQDYINDLSLKVDDMIRLEQNKDLNEPLVNNSEIRDIALEIRKIQGKDVTDIGRGKDEILVNLSKLATDSKFNLPEFKRLITEKYLKKVENKAEFFRKVDDLKLGRYLKTKKNVFNRAELTVDVVDADPNTGEITKVNVFPSPHTDLKGNPVNTGSGQNKYNAAIKAGDGVPIRIILRKSYIMSQLHKYGKGDNAIDVFSKDVESPLGFHKLKKGNPDFLPKEAIVKIRKALQEQETPLYLFGGAKDSGVLVVHRVPFTDAQFSTASQRQVLRELGLSSKIVNAEGYQVKETVSNIYYLLRESGYMDVNDPINVSNLVKGLKKFRKQPLYETVQAFNKYNNLAQGSDIRLENEYGFIKDVGDESTFKFIQIKDLESKFEVGGVPSKSAIDAVVYVRQDVFDAIRKKNYLSSRNGFLKMVGFSAPRDGNGTILLKTGTFKATKKMDAFMQANNIHFMTAESATKTSLGLKTHDIVYKNNRWDFGTADKQIRPYEMRADELYLNFGVYENYSKLNMSMPISKQIFDKINYEQLGEDGPAFRAAYEKFVNESLAGDPATNKAFERALVKQDGNYEIPNLFRVDIELINRALTVEHIDTPFGRNVLKKIMERGNEDYHSLIYEQGDVIDKKLFGVENIDIPDLLAQNDYRMSAITHPGVREFVNKSLTSYLHMRAIRPTASNAVDIKLGPADLEVAAGLQDNQVKFGQGMKNFLIKIKGQSKQVRLEDAWNTFKDMKKSDNRYNDYKEALTFMAMRNPNSGNGGVRILEMAGFVAREGTAAVTTSKTDYYLGGADKDADSIALYQNMPGIFKKVFSKYESELQRGRDTYSFENVDPQSTFATEKLIEEYPNIKVSEGSRKALEDLLTTDSRIDVARQAKIGKVNIDFIVSGFNRMQVVADLIQQEGGVINSRQAILKKVKGKLEPSGLFDNISIKLKKGVDIKQLQLDTYLGINYMADSANFVKMEKYPVILETFWKKYFEVTNLNGNRNITEFQQNFRNVEKLNALQTLHNVVYKGKNLSNRSVADKAASDYLDAFGKQNHFYGQLATVINNYSSFGINPFKYLFSKNFKNYNNYEVAREYTLRLREEIVKNEALIKRFGILDNYTSIVEAKAALDRLIKSENYSAFYNKMIEYQSMHRAMEMSNGLIRTYAGNERSKYSNDTLELEIKSLIDNTWTIKSMFNRDLNLVPEGFAKENLSMADINQYIYVTKAKIKAKYKDEPSLAKDLINVYEAWLLATPKLDRPLNELQQSALDTIFAENKFIERGSISGNTTSVGFDNALVNKQKAFLAYAGTPNYMLQSLAISAKGRRDYFDYLETQLVDRSERISKRLNQQKNNPEEHTLESLAKEAAEQDISVKDNMKRILDTEALVGTVLEKFDFIKTNTGNRNKAITRDADKQLKRLQSLLRESPDAIMRLEEQFIELTYRLEGLGRRLDTANVKDLKLFVDALEVYWSAKKPGDKVKKFFRAPGGRDNILNYTYTQRDLRLMEKMERETNPRLVLDKFGKIVPMRIKVPTSTLELGRLTIDRFDTFQKTINAAQQDKINGLFEYLNNDNPNLIQYRDLLFEAAVNKIEWNDGKFPSNTYNKLQQEAIRKAWSESSEALSKLEKEGIMFDMSSPGGKAVRKDVTANEYVDRIVKDVKEFLSDIQKVYIDSRVDMLEKTLPRRSKKFIGSNTKDKNTKRLEDLFLTETGLIDLNTVNLLFKDLSNRNVSEREYIGKFLISINDYRFIKHHLEVFDRIQFKLGDKIDLNKPLNSKNKNIVKGLVLQELNSTKNKPDYYERYAVGKVEEGYFPRNGHGRNEAERKELEAWNENRALEQLKEAAEDPTQLPEKIRVEMELGNIDMQQALSLYREQLLGNAARNTNQSLTSGQAEAERQIIDLLSRPNIDGFIGDYAAGSTLKRGQDFMPFYRKDLDALRNYTGGLFKMWFTNLAGLRSEVLLKQFDYTNKGETYARDWSNYMRNAFTNMMGLSTYRAYNIHGIEKKDQQMFRDFIASGFKRGKYSGHMKDKIIDFEIAIEPSPVEKRIILRRQDKSLSTKERQKAANKEILALKTKRAKELVEQVNTTGKYGTLYHYTSDEAAVSFFKKIDKIFGGRMFKDLNKMSERDKNFEIIRRIRDFSDLEGKFELLTLLSHPKTAITNLYGGTQNTISDTGWKPFRQANDTEWMIKNLFDNGKAEFSFLNQQTGRVEKKRINTKERIYEWMESLGVFDQMFLDLVALDKNFGRQGQRKFFEEFIRRMNKSYREGIITTETIHNREAKKTLREVARDLKIEVPITELGALPMKWSERILRGNAFLANYINLHQNVIGPNIAKGIPFDSRVLTNFAMKGIEASQFMYQATFRPNFANTSLGRVLTRFQPYAWNSIGRRIKLFKDAQQSGWNREVLASKKFQRQFTFDLMALAMANIFVASIFEYALSPPMNWLQDSAALLFGDEKERERAFFSSYPSPVLAPLQIVTPPIGRFVLSPITSILNGDFENFTKYQLATYFPFGRLGRDAYRTFNSPAMAVDFMTGLPLHQVHELRRDKIELDKLEQQAKELEEELVE